MFDLFGLTFLLLYYSATHVEERIDRTTRFIFISQHHHSSLEYSYLASKHPSAARPTGSKINS